MIKRGKLLIPSKTYLEKNEQKTIDFLLNLGNNIEVITPINKPYIKTADIKMRGLTWEIKNPTGKGKRTLLHNFSDALHQSNNVIFDLRNCKKNEEKCINELKVMFKTKSRCKRLIIINKHKKYLDFIK